MKFMESIGFYNENKRKSIAFLVFYFRMPILFFIKRQRENNMLSIKDNDKLYRFLFQHQGVRGEWVRLNQTFIETLNTHHYPLPVQNLLGEMMVATALLTATLKFNGQISLQLQGDGALRLALVNGNEQQQLRALARIKGDISPEMTLQEMIGNGVLVITISPEQGERYQGIVALDKPTLSACLETYFMQSEQLPTQLILYAGQQNDRPVASGLLLQVIPDGTGSANDFEHLTTLAHTITAQECFTLDVTSLLHRLFHQEDIALYPAQPVSFYCGCSFERSRNALKMLDHTELETSFSENNGVIHMQCECCGQHYQFDRQSLDASQK